jgi:hypothetical protein
MGLRAVAVAVALLYSTSAAYADDKPWAVGVSQENQDKALEVFKQGNESFVKDEWREALDLYLEALKFWDHPNIRYNAAICLIKLDRMVEAYEHMQAAMRFGDAPLGNDLFKQGETYLQILKTSTSYVEVICKQPEGVTVTVDGEQLAKCPETKLVKPGKHQIVSEKPGYRTNRQEITAPPGGKETVVIVMEVEGSRKLTRRWARWKPWAVVGTGAAVTLVGVPLWFVAQGKFDNYDDDVRDYCRPMGGCAPGQIDRFDGQLSSAKTWRVITYSTLAIGATTVAAGVVLLVMNQPKLGPLVVTPTTDQPGVSITGSF